MRSFLLTLSLALNSPTSCYWLYSAHLHLTPSITRITAPPPNRASARRPPAATVVSFYLELVFLGVHLRHLMMQTQTRLIETSKTHSYLSQFLITLTQYAGAKPIPRVWQSKLSSPVDPITYLNKPPPLYSQAQNPSHASGSLSSPVQSTLTP